MKKVTKIIYEYDDGSVKETISAEDAQYMELLIEGAGLSVSIHDGKFKPINWRSIRSPKPTPRTGGYYDLNMIWHNDTEEDENDS